MKRVKRIAVTCLCMAVVMGAVRPGEAAEAKEKAPLIQMAILLDTSGSMSGLIAQAKTQLWSIVNEFATTKRDGKVPEFQVALYEYGKSSIPASENYLRMIVPLSTDLDKVSEELFALRTNGGQEYCGTVIQASVEGLAWSKSNDDFKAIFIAGNEPFTQGKVDYRAACKKAIENGIVVNTIHCGSYDVGVNTKWKDGAVIADGTYTHIDQNRAVVHVNAPQDKEILRLNAELNKTYVPYGARGLASAARQKKQDANSKGVSGATLATRVAAKSSVHYRNAAWDLVDALRDGKVELEKLKEADLPENMKKMSPEERKQHVEEQQKKRAELQKKVRDLTDARKKFVAAEMKKRGKAEGGTLGAAMLKAVRAQAAKKNFK